MVTAVREGIRVERAPHSSFDDLFLAEYSRVVGIARRVLGDTGEAEDVAQEVFCSFYRSHQAGAPYAAAWLHRAAAHSALNVIRGRRRRRHREEADAADRTRWDSSTALGIDPQRAAELSEQRREVRAALARLPEKHGAVLALRYSGLSYAETAAALGVGINQVGTLLRRAESALRKEMTDGTPR